MDRGLHLHVLLLDYVVLNLRGRIGHRFVVFRRRRGHHKLLLFGRICRVQTRRRGFYQDEIVLRDGGKLF